ncbi:MAG: hypothetical protein ACRC0G_10070 [Fusobacteriaceae bacterium]
MKKQSMMYFKLNGSGYSQWMDAIDTNVEGERGKVSQSVTDTIEFVNASSGDILNVYEKLLLDVKWQMLDEDVGSTFILGRSHMFYTPSNKFYKRIINEVSKDSQELSLEVDRIYNAKSPLTLLSSSFSTLVSFDMVESDIGMKTFYDTKMYKEESKDESVYDTLIGNSTKKICENHFAISGHNLIFHEIAVNDETYNTVKIDYGVLFLNESTLMTILPNAYTPGTSKTDHKTFEKLVPPMIDVMAEQMKRQDRRKSSEYLSNMLLEELRWAYQGKIFITFNPSIKQGDTITLVDSLSSTFGKFYIDSYEHKFDSRGMITVLNVKACFDLVDPYIDVYSNKIAVEMSAELGKHLKTMTLTSTEEIALNNLAAIYTRTQLSNIKYCQIFECEEPNFFDSTKEYAKVENLAALNPCMAVRFFPFSKRGKMQIPDSLKPAFIYSETNPFGSFIDRILKSTHEMFVSGFRNFSSWTKSMCMFLGDTALDILTGGLHELLKATTGYNFVKGKETMLGTSALTSEAVNILMKQTDYSNNQIRDKYDFTFGFFNVEAQRKTNVAPGVSNDDVHITYEKVKTAVDKKTATIKKIISEYFDVCGCVEMYDSFKFDDSVYSIFDFIKDCTPTGYGKGENEIFTNRYGTEKGVLFFDKNKMDLAWGDSIFPATQTTKTFKQSSGDATRCYIETTVDVSTLGYKNKSGGLIDKIKFIWFHNIFGSTDLNVDSRKENIKDLVKTYGELYPDLETASTGVIILGDHNLEVVNPDRKFRTVKESNIYLFLDRDVKSYGFRNYMTKPTTLSKDGNVTGSIYENVLLSANLINNKNYIDIMRVMYDYPGVKKSEVSDHVPAFVGFKKRI